MNYQFKAVHCSKKIKLTLAYAECNFDKELDWQSFIGIINTWNFY